jgi:GntR family transcriptional regulator/MocR family aminotransferase
MPFREVFAFRTKLPGTRTLSQILEVHRNTIVAVYDELFAQGWVESFPNKGTFIIGKTKKNQLISIINLQNYPKSTGFSFKTSNILDNPFEHSDCEFILNDGAPDIA